MTFLKASRQTGLRSRAYLGSVLVLINFGGGKALQLVSNLILTRLLVPDAFGLMTLVSVFVTGLALISDIGISPSVIRSKRADDPVFQSTAWSLQFVRGLGITALAWLLAWPYARVYDQPQLVPLICVASLSAAAAGFNSIEMTMYERRLDFGKVVTVNLASQAIAVMITVAVTYALRSVWGLAIGSVSAALVGLVLGHLVFPSANHRFAWDRATLNEIVTFGRWIMIGTLFTYLGGQGLSAIQGVLVDLDTLAFLSIAGMFGWVIGELTSAILGRVAFPVFSEIFRERPERLAPVVNQVELLSLSITIPGFLLLSVIAEPLIDLLYDHRYSTAGEYLALLALNGAIGVIPMVRQDAMIATGNSRAHSVVMGIHALSVIVGSVTGFYLGGPTGMIVGIGSGTMVAALASFVATARHGFGPPRTSTIAIFIVLVVYVLQLKGHL